MTAEPDGLGGAGWVGPDIVGIGDDDPAMVEAFFCFGGTETDSGPLQATGSANESPETAGSLSASGSGKKKRRGTPVGTGTGAPKNGCFEMMIAAAAVADNLVGKK